MAREIDVDTDTVAEILKMNEDGCTVKEIAAEVELSAYKVGELLMSLGVPKRAHIRTEPMSERDFEVIRDMKHREVDAQDAREQLSVPHAEFNRAWGVATYARYLKER